MISIHTHGPIRHRHGTLVFTFQGPDLRHGNHPLRHTPASHSSSLAAGGRGGVSEVYSLHTRYFVWYMDKLCVYVRKYSEHACICTPATVICAMYGTL